jgi:L-fuculose-phosphate aldolase
MSYSEEKKSIIYWAHLLNQKGLVTARSGNISLRVKNNVAITAHNTYLGQLEEQDIVVVDMKGNLVDGAVTPSSERAMHLDILNKFKDINVVIHSHSPYSTAFFHYFEKIEIFSFEAKFYLGTVPVVNQRTPTVTDTTPVLKVLDSCNVVVLGNHGVVAMGKDFKEAFSLIELLEEQAKISFMAKSMRLVPHRPLEIETEHKAGNRPRHKLLSPEHVACLQEFVNNDTEILALGEQLGLSCTLAVHNEDNNDTVCFYYEAGRITRMDDNQNAEFVINGSEEILKRVFNREIDPFVASTQGKIKMKGDFARLSRWYPVMVKTFALWGKVEVF